eukprot:8735287-Alexandrium_andersonii.AAC.1
MPRATSETPDVRSRYVAKVSAFWKGDAMFAATPPSEAARLLLSDLATRKGNCELGRRLGARKA